MELDNKKEVEQYIPSEEKFKVAAALSKDTCANDPSCSFTSATTNHNSRKRICTAQAKNDSDEKNDEKKLPAKKHVCTQKHNRPENHDDHLENADDEDEDEDMVVIAEEFVRNIEEQQYGLEKTIFAGNGPIKIINPAFRESSSAHKHWPNGRPSVWIEARLFAPSVNLYVCKGHLNHLVDTELIARLHSYTNGMLNRWRVSSMDIIREVMDTATYSHENLQHQFTFARKYVLKAMAGIAEVKTFPIHILNATALRALVKGIDTAEMAELVQKMANATYFSIIAHPYTELNELHIETRFNMNDKNKKAFGVRPYKMANPEKAIAVTINRNRFP